MIIDVHCHYTFTRREAHNRERFSFEPAVENGQPTLDSCVAPRALRRPMWRLTKRLFGLDPRLPAGPELDESLGDFYDGHLLAEGPVERIVLLAFDAYHDDQGRRMPPPVARGDVGGDIYTSNSLVHDACRRRPDRYLFGASVHPYRKNAVACVEDSDNFVRIPSLKGGHG